jgi:large subunit ribosomal protein L9
MKQLDSIKAQLASKETKITKRLTDLAGQLGLVAVKTTLKMCPEGAFGTITHSDIADLLAKEGHEVDRHSIVIAEPIKAPGVYDIGIKLGHEVTATVKLWVAEEPA